MFEYVVSLETKAWQISFIMYESRHRHNIKRTGTEEHTHKKTDNQYNIIKGPDGSTRESP